MSRRQRGPYIRREPCAHAGCREVAFFEYDTLQERADSYRNRHPWKCSRHTNPEQILSPLNTYRQSVVTVRPIEGLSKSVMSFAEIRNGVIHGPGFKAYAEDFPEGTRIRVTVEVLP
jgi:hypothetical protein